MSYPDMKQDGYQGQTHYTQTQPMQAQNMGNMNFHPTQNFDYAKDYRQQFVYHDSYDEKSKQIRQNFINSMKKKSRPLSAMDKPPFQHQHSQQMKAIINPSTQIEGQPQVAKDGLCDYHPQQQNIEFSHPLSSSFRLNAKRINQNEIAGPKVRDLIEYNNHPVGDMIPTQMMRHHNGQLDPYQKIYERARASSPKSNHGVEWEQFPLVDPSVYPWPHQDNPHPFPTHASQYKVNRRNGSVLHPQQVNSNLCVPQRYESQYHLCNVTMIRKPDDEEIFWVFKEQINFLVKLDALKVALCKQPDFRAIDFYQKCFVGKTGKIIPDSFKAALESIGVIADAQDCGLILIAYNGHSNMKFKNFAKMFQPDVFCEKILNDNKPYQKEYSPQTTDILRQFFRVLLQCEYIFEVMRQTITKKKVNLKQVFKNLSKDNEGLCTFYSLQFFFQTYKAHEITPFGIKLLMKRIDKNLRGAIPMVDFLNYFDAKIKKFSSQK